MSPRALGISQKKRLALKARPDDGQAQDNFSSLLMSILFMLRQRGIHFVPRVRVTCPDVHLWFEPARIIQARGSDRNNLRSGIGLDHNRRPAVRAKAPAGHATHFAGRWMKVGRALQELESFRWHDD
jgi:hypothetical protein